VDGTGPGQTTTMWLFLSSRLRRWLLVAFVLPFAGRGMEAVGTRLATSRPRASRALTGTGQRLQAGRRRGRRRR